MESEIIRKLGDHPAFTSTPIPKTNDEDFARLLQMEEVREYQEQIAARKSQCDSDYKLAMVLADCSSFMESSVDDVGKSGKSFSVPTAPKNSQPSVANFTSSPTSHPVESSHLTETSSRDSNNSALTDGITRPSVDAQRFAALTPSQEESNVEVHEGLNDERFIVISDDEAEFSECFEELQDAVEPERQSESGQTSDNDSPEDSREAHHRRYANSEDIDSSSAAASSSGVSYSPIRPCIAGGQRSEGHSDEVSHSGESQMSSEPSDSESDDIDCNVSTTTEAAEPDNLFDVINSVVGSAVSMISEFFSPSFTARDPQTETMDSYDDYDDDDDNEDFDEEEFEDDEDDNRDEDSEIAEGDGEYTLDHGEEGGNRGMCQEDIDVLPVWAYRCRREQGTGATDGPTDSDRTECQVCLSEFAEGEMLRSLPCLHQFHQGCIDAWLRKVDICPICRLKPSAEMFA